MKSKEIKQLEKNLVSHLATAIDTANENLNATATSLQLGYVKLNRERTGRVRVVIEIMPC